MRAAAVWTLTGLAAFLLLDATLAIVLGRGYMLGGLDYTPDGYRRLIERIAELPLIPLLGIKVAEGSVGIGLFLASRRLRRARGSRRRVLS